jgi:hypothetical protein
VEDIGISIAMHQSAAWKDTETRSTTGGQHHRQEKKAMRKSLSAQQSGEEEDLMQETPEAALVAAQAYLLTTQPEPGDLWEHMHHAEIRSLGLIEDKLMGKLPEEKETYRIYRGQEGTVRDRLKASQVYTPRLLSIHTLFD